MDIVSILMIALGLSMDAFAVAIATSVGIGQVTSRQIFRFSFHFGLFQATMPILGWLLGVSAADYIRQWDHWVAFGLLGLVGGKAVWGALRGKDEPQSTATSDPTTGLSLVLFSVATSIDALAVGLTLATLEVRIWLPVVVIGSVTAFLTLLGMLLGGRIGARLGKRIEVLGGLILIGIGIKILAGHMLGG